VRFCFLINHQSKQGMVEKKNKIYLTTPIYYVNALPHIGHAYTTLAIDVLSRYYQAQGKEVFFLTGTDEHGAKIFEAARKAGKEPQVFCDEMAELFKKTWQDLNIDFSYFIRTTYKQHQEKVRDFLTVLKEKGYLYKSVYEGNYCVGCEKFITDKDLVEGKCPDHNCFPQKISEENWFFKLKEFLNDIEKLIAEDKILVSPAQAKAEVLGVIKQGLDDISISRKNVSWGIPLPWESTQTIYVWVDALLNYWTALQNLGKTAFWPPDLHLVGRDILKFHCIFWPALLLAYYGRENIEQLPRHIFCHGYFTVNGQKMSKTIGNVISPNDLIQKYGSDATRYLLLTQFPFGNDGDISLSKLAQKYNSDLAKGLGNFAARVITLAKNTQSDIGFFKTSPEYEELQKGICTTKIMINDFLEKLKIDQAIDAIWQLVKIGDKIIDREKPWQNVDISQKEKNKKVIADLLQILKEIALMLQPFMPQTAQKILAQIKMGKAEPLFPRL